MEAVSPAMGRDPTRGVRTALAFLALAALTAPPARSDESRTTNDWPGFWGPTRSASVSGPLRIEPGTELREVWRRPLGKGYSEIAVMNGRGYALFTDGELDQLIAFDSATGAEIWRASMEETHRAIMGSEDGPLSSPLVHGERVFTLDAFGRLFAFDLRSGRRLWKRDLATDYSAEAPVYGFATSPLAVGRNLIVQVGGPEDTVVALEQETGATVWSAGPSESNGYASPILVTLAEMPQIVGVTTDRIFGLDRENGSVLWAHTLANGPLKSPTILPDDRILVASWDDTALFKVERRKGAFTLEEKWRTPTLKANYSPVVFHEGYVYGMNRTYLTCLDPETGEVEWRQKVYEANLILVAGYLAVLGQKSGSLQLVAATPTGFREVLTAAVFTPGARTVTGPTFAGGRFLMRNGEEMVMLEVSDPGSETTNQGTHQ